MKIRLAAPLQSDSIVDGEGIRTVIWTQGCGHHCKGCHNPETWSFEDGYLVDVKDIIKEIDNISGQDGITLSGGDPLYQVDACLEIAKHCKERNLNVWCYTGFLFEELLKDDKYLELLKYIDVLVDGPFILSQRSLDLKFKGSENQRVIDVPNSLKEEKIVLVSKYIDKKEYNIKKKTSVYI